MRAFACVQACIAPHAKTALASRHTAFKHPHARQDLCVEVVALNFEHSPTFGPLPDKYIRKITSTLALDLPLELVGTVGGQFSLQLVSWADWHMRVYESLARVLQRGSTYQGTGSALPECAPACRRSLLLTRTTGNGGATRGGRVLRWVPEAVAAAAAAAAQLDSRFVPSPVQLTTLCAHRRLHPHHAHAPAQPTAHGNSYKQMYFERNLQDAIEQ